MLIMEIVKKSVLTKLKKLNLSFYIYQLKLFIAVCTLQINHIGQKKIKNIYMDFSIIIHFKSNFTLMDLVFMKLFKYQNLMTQETN